MASEIYVLNVTNVLFELLVASEESLSRKEQL